MIYVIKYRTNDLIPDKGKQVEFGKSIVSKVFGFTGNSYDVSSKCVSLFDGQERIIKTHFKLSGARGDYKIYQNNDGSEDLKDVLINVFNLTPSNNSDDYLGIKKVSDDAYIFYHIPKDTLFSKCFAFFGNAFEVINDEDPSVQNTLYPNLPPSPLDLPFQSIYYGTPGTGKSYAAKLEEAKFDKVFRTTFHPEYDYASFVGCYKPKTDIVDNTKVIIYDFDPQVFTKAYEYAWSRPDKKVLLVIEEINRGNCAQIFGDLFQLLDRDRNGVSKYPINIDLDMLGYLRSKLQENHSEAVSESKIKLPGNLYIIATMNTSDQSLFPMDSAFKRRWVWKYFPIKEYTGRVFKIKIGGTECKWWDFVLEINKRIENVTMSPDKQIGYWFINPDTDVIESEEFVGKVLFYLWNDVFKDYPDNSESPFMNIKFKDMFNVDGSPNDANIIKFMQELNLMKSNEHNSIPFAPEVRPLSMAAEPQAES